MLASQIPNKFSIPFGNSADAGTIRPVPAADQSTISPGAASLTKGFPAVTGQPVASGGIPPAMQDFNGLLNQITAWNRWQNAGGTVAFDAAFSTAVGGYPSGAILASTTTGVLWLNTTDNNTTNPDSGSSSGWIGILTQGSVIVAKSAGRLIGVKTFTSSGTYTPSSGMTYCVVEGVGGGGAGGGAGGASGAGNVSLGAPGTSGTYGRAFFFSGQISSSQSVTIGAGGAAISNGTGGNGTATSMGSLLSLPPGVGGQTLTQQVAPTINGNGTTSGAATGANIVSLPGTAASYALAVTSGIATGGPGGSNPLGNGGYGSNVNGVGASGTGYGSGGSGCVVNASGGSIAGGPGAPGVLIITEYGIAP